MAPGPVAPDPDDVALEVDARLDRLDEWLDATGIGRLTLWQRDTLRLLWIRDEIAQPPGNAIDRR